jgi:tetratricopeptide (TPR) repeat protein
MGLDIFMSAPDDPIAFLELSERIAKATGKEDQIERPQVNLNALQGKESKWFSIRFERSDSDRFRQYFHALPATLMVPDKYHPLSDHYETLYETTEQHDVPYAIYASAKYCRGLGLDQECLRYEQQLLDKASDDPDYEAARYFYHSLKAFDAWIEGDHTTTLAFIDSAYQYFPGFWESQVACLDKTFMLADIYEQQGEYTRSIAYLENIPAVQGYGLSKGYATYRLTQLYELTEEHGKAIAKCNWLIKNYKDCDEVYRPWVEEVTARRDRLMKRIL